FKVPPLLSHSVDFDRFLKFKIQHIIKPDEMEKGCDAVINSRQIRNEHTGKCKPLNTFILHSVENVIPVCESGVAITGKNLKKSKGKFHTVLCSLSGNENDNPCRYTSINENENIVIACEAGEPVHLEDPRKYSHIIVN
uniref:Ribonuclease A-domain domain-containing protein n=1 Tax=Cyprinodon variegatus TaxID=28743 RepID=A0A3Q2CD80_CYPVA